MNEAEEDVFGADVTVVEQTRFFLGQHHDSTGPVCEAFEHAHPFATARRRVWLMLQVAWAGSEKATGHLFPCRTSRFGRMRPLAGGSENRHSLPL